MSLPFGFTAILLGLLASVVGAHMKARRYFDRPSLARNKLFDPALGFLKWALILSGLFLLDRASRRAAVATAIALLLLWGYRRFIRSVSFQSWLLRRDYDALKRRRPDLPERAILHELLMSRHARWGEELVEQIVLDYPTFDDLAPIIAKMERGFRGFKS